MSGSGGGGWGTFNEPEVSCESLIIETQLTSPKEEVIARIAVNTILGVTLQQAGTSTVVVITHEGEVAGGIASPNMNRLRECIQAGTRYGATVTSKTDGQVHVRIAPIRG